jgi:hypothetical protein
MPAIVPIIAGVAAVIQAKMASNAAKRATNAQSRSTSEALTLERDNEARRRQEYDQMIAEQRAQYDAEQARRAPYREASYLTLRDIARSRGREIGEMRQPPPYRPPPYTLGGIAGGQR